MRDGTFADPDQRHSRLLDLSGVGQPDARSGADDREVTVPARHLDKGLARRLAEGRQAHFGDDLRGIERRGEGAHEEVRRGDRALARRPSRDDLAIKQEQDPGHLGGGIRVRDHAAHRSPGLDADVAELKRLREHR